MPGRPQQLGLAALALAVLFFASPCRAEPPGYESDIRVYNLAHGRMVFSDKCMRCHESGRKGAPVLGDTGDWRERLEQPLEELIEHATVGHGDMPARGDQDVIGQDVADAVAYVVNRMRVIAAREDNLQPATAAVVSPDEVGELFDRAVVQMFLMLVGKDRWK